MYVFTDYTDTFHFIIFGIFTDTRKGGSNYISWSVCVKERGGGLVQPRICETGYRNVVSSVPCHLDVKAS